MDYPNFLHAQAAAIVEQFFAAYNIAWIAVPDTETLMRRQSFDHGGQVANLPGMDATEAVVWRDSKNRPELWVRTEDKAINGTDLYARAWKAFVKQFAGVAPTPQAGGRALQADHLYPETAAIRADLNFVRVMAVDARSNVLLGSTTEKLAAGGKLGRAGRPRSATYFTLAKVSGFQESFGKSKSASDVTAALLNFLRAKGYPVPKNATPDASLEHDLTTSKLNWFRGTN